MKTPSDNKFVRYAFHVQDRHAQVGKKNIAAYDRKEVFTMIPDVGVNLVMFSFPSC
jgi:hypothetical protein